MSQSIVFNKSKKFAVRIIHLYQYMSREKNEYVICKQLLRSGTSIGANIAEALVAFSRKDFLAKMYIAFRECFETPYWFDIMLDSDYITKSQYESLTADCTELSKMLSAITKSMRESQ